MGKSLLFIRAMRPYQPYLLVGTAGNWLHPGGLSFSHSYQHSETLIIAGHWNSEELPWLAGLHAYDPVSAPGRWCILRAMGASCLELFLTLPCASLPLAGSDLYQLWVQLFSVSSVNPSNKLLDVRVVLGTPLNLKWSGVLGRLFCLDQSCALISQSG